VRHAGSARNKYSDLRYLHKCSEARDDPTPRIQSIRPGQSDIPKGPVTDPPTGIHIHPNATAGTHQDRNTHPTGSYSPSLPLNTTSS